MCDSFNFLYSSMIVHCEVSTLSCFHALVYCFNRPTDIAGREMDDRVQQSVTVFPCHRPY